MDESTFLAQLEQRTEQVKITLANLEAERTRIEGMIAQLQPLVPHYDALISAERALKQADIDLDLVGRQLRAGSQATEEQAQPEQRYEPESHEAHGWGEEAQPEQREETHQDW